MAKLALLGRLSLSRLFEEASRVLQTRTIAFRISDAGLAADIDTTAHLHAVQSKVMREQKQAKGVKVTAVFDLDRTITRFGTYTPFLLFSAWRMGKRRLLCLPIVVALMGLYRVGLLERGRLKELMFEFLRGPTSLERLRPHIDAFASFVVRRGLRPGAVAALAYENENGARIMMATAALDIYARAIADRLGIQDVIVTVMRVECGTVLPVIESGNCHGERKWARIHQALVEPAHVVFYTDDASDLPTLTQVSEGFVVNPKSRFSKIAHHLGLPVLKW